MRCKGVLQTGKRKGERCPYTATQDDFCRSHSKEKDWPVATTPLERWVRPSKITEYSMDRETLLMWAEKVRLNAVYKSENVNQLLRDLSAQIEASDGEDVASLCGRFDEISNLMAFDNLRELSREFKKDAKVERQVFVNEIVEAQLGVHFKTWNESEEIMTLQEQIPMVSERLLQEERNLQQQAKLKRDKEMRDQRHEDSGRRTTTQIINLISGEQKDAEKLFAENVKNCIPIPELWESFSEVKRLDDEVRQLFFSVKRDYGRRYENERIKHGLTPAAGQLTNNPQTPIGRIYHRIALHMMNGDINPD